MSLYLKYALFHILVTEQDRKGFMTILFDETIAMKKHWTRIRGVVKKGDRVASGMAKDTPFPDGTLKMQLPIFKKLGFDLQDVYPATLNIHLGSIKFRMIAPEYKFVDVRWYSKHVPETFSFSRCRVIYKQKVVDGWIYYPHPETKIKHFKDSSTLEILAPYIEGIRYGESVKVDIDETEIQLLE